MSLALPLVKFSGWLLGEKSEFNGSTATLPFPPRLSVTGHTRWQTHTGSAISERVGCLIWFWRMNEFKYVQWFGQILYVCFQTEQLWMNSSSISNIKIVIWFKMSAQVGFCYFKGFLTNNKWFYTKCQGLNCHFSKEVFRYQKQNIIQE